jgi:hypothetical protein
MKKTQVEIGATYIAKVSGMRALSIRQPWGSLIVKGYKDVENRTWRTSYRGPLLIHAALRLDPKGFEFAHSLGIDILPEDCPRGGIIGMAELVDCVTHHPSAWWRGPFAFVLANVEQLPFRPLRGRLGIFPA